MAHVVQSAQTTRSAQSDVVGVADPAAEAALAQTTIAADSEKVLPLPGWLVKVYFIFPVILYIPDALFNYYVYSDGAFGSHDPNPLIQIGSIALWGFLAIGVVGMAYLLSVLAPWHWGQGHRIQALFCGVGVLVATAITTWNSLAYRSQNFSAFPTDQWVYGIWPQLQQQHFSLTMILVAIAPPFWGLFWALVQPTTTGRSLRQLQESHAERLMRVQQEAEVKRLRAETNAKVREAQLRGMAATAASVRAQATELIKQNAQNTGKPGQADGERAAQDGADATNAANTPTSEANDADGSNSASGGANERPSGILQYPTFTPTRTRDLNGNRAAMMNHAASATTSVRAEPSGASRPLAAQPALMSDADVQGTAGVPMGDAAAWGPRRPPTLGGGIEPTFFPGNSSVDGMTGTTGPRPAIHRAADPSPLLRAMNEPSPLHVRAVQESMLELNPSGTRKSVPARELAAHVAEKLNVDESSARQIINRVREAQKTARSNS
ncbi:MAG: hypothetical protein ABI068_09645 [Ktedonobacterales bacterium]